MMHRHGNRPFASLKSLIFIYFCPVIIVLFLNARYGDPTLIGIRGARLAPCLSGSDRTVIPYSSSVARVIAVVPLLHRCAIAKAIYPLPFLLRPVACFLHFRRSPPTYFLEPSSICSCGVAGCFLRRHHPPLPSCPRHPTHTHATTPPYRPHHPSLALPRET